MFVKFSQELVWRQTEPALLNQRLQIELTRSERVSGRVSDKIAPHNMSSIAHACNTDDIKMQRVGKNVVYITYNYVILRLCYLR